MQCWQTNIYTELVPEECGWCLYDRGKLTLLWYEGDQAPSTVADVMGNGEEVETEEGKNLIKSNTYILP